MRRPSLQTPSKASPLRAAVLVAGLVTLALGLNAWRRAAARSTGPNEGPNRETPGGSARAKATSALETKQTRQERSGKPHRHGPVGLTLQWLAGHRFLLGVLVTLAASGASGLGFGFYLYKGGFDTSASKSHIKLVAVVAHDTMINSVRKRSQQIRAPDHFTSEQVLAGAKLYEEHCIACHGGAAVARAPWAATMTPPPPFVIDSARNWSKADLYMILQQGVKMSAMPAWGEILPDAALWNVVAFLEAMPTLSPADYRVMRQQVRAQPTTPMGASGPAVSLAPQPLQATQPLDRTVEPGETALPTGAASKPDDATRATASGGTTPPGGSGAGATDTGQPPAPAGASRIGQGH